MRRLLGVWILIAVIAVIYWPTVAAYSAAWTDLDNRGSAHGFLIALMCFALLYVRRKEVAAPLTAVSPVAYIALASLSFAWVVAYRASIQTAHELLFPIILWAAIYAVFGARVARSCLFPVGFLYFALPFWGLFNGVFQALTISATHIILQVFGLPVHFQGNLVRIPEGTFAIEGGCSGLHFIVIGLAIAAYYGALYRDSARQRVQLLLLAGALALLTNWIRVSVVIAAGHFTNMQSYLVRVSHYEFGWAVFAVAMAIFFLVASRIPAGSRETESPPAAADLKSQARPWLGTALAFAAVALGPACAWASARADRTASAPPSLPVSVPGWSGPLTPASNWHPKFIGADRERLSTYRRGAAEVTWYQADYAFQRQGRKLLGFNNSILGLHELTVVDDDTARGAGRFVDLKLQDTDGAQSLLWYVYKVGTREMTSGLYAQLWYGVRSLAAPVDSRVMAFRAECKPDCAAAHEHLRLFVASICDDASRFNDCRRDP
jgi:exosortase